LLVLARTNWPVPVLIVVSVAVPLKATSSMPPLGARGVTIQGHLLAAAAVISALR
jgi:hypothetical protein